MKKRSLKLFKEEFKKLEKKKNLSIMILRRTKAKYLSKTIPLKNKVLYNFKKIALVKFLKTNQNSNS